MLNIYFACRFFFTLPNYKKIRSAAIIEEEEVVSVDLLQTTTFQPPPPGPFTLTTRGAAQISPETAACADTVSSSSGDIVAVVDAFAHIVPRPLWVRGVCKVLLVDDSSFNVKIMRNILKKVSATWLRTGTTETSLSEVGDRQGLLQPQAGRGSVHMLSSEDTASPAAPTINNSETNSTVSFDYSEADDGVVAVQMVQAAGGAGVPFDTVVFMDNIMILMHGPEAAQAMRAAGFAGLIIGVTGNVMAQDVSQYIHSGADHVLSKPVNIEDLKQILKRLT